MTSMMKNMFFVPVVMALTMFISCESDGNSSIPDIPDEPSGVRTFTLSRNGSAIYVDDTSNSMNLDADGCLSGENLFFSALGKCNGISYITAIPISGWMASSDSLKKGYGYVMGSRRYDGATFTRLYVETVDSVNGDVVLKSLSPFYGNSDKFYLNHKQMFLFKEAGDTNVVMIKPATYDVTLVRGEWMRLVSHITYVKLFFDENKSGMPRVDTLIFSNGKFPEKRIPITQLHYSENDSLFME